MITVVFSGTVWLVYKNTTKIHFLTSIASGVGQLSENNKTHLLPGFRKINQPSQIIRNDEPEPLIFSEETIIGVEEKAKGSIGLLSCLRSIDVDYDKNIYLADYKQSQIFKFDPHGNLLASIGKEGAGGPGDSLQPAALFIRDKHDLFVYDSQLQRLSFFDVSGKFNDCTRLLDLFGDWVFIDGKQRVFYRAMEYTTHESYDALVKTSKDGSQKELLASFFRKKFDQNKTIIAGGIIDPYFPSLYFANISPDRFVFVNNMEPVLYIVDTTKDTIALVHLDLKPVPISTEEKKAYEYSYKNQLQNMHLESYRPYFYKILADNRGRIFAVRLKNCLDKVADWKIDMFSPKGEYLRSVKSPYLPEAIKYDSMYITATDDAGEPIIKKLTITNL